MRYAVVDGNNRVINAILWDGESEYDPGEGFDLVRSDTLQIGDSSVAPPVQND